MTFVDLESGSEGIKLAPESHVPLRDSLVKGGILYTCDVHYFGFTLTKARNLLLAYDLEALSGLKWYMLTTTDFILQPSFIFRWFVGEEYVFTTGLYGINISRFMKRWELPGLVPAGIVDGKLICASQDKVFAFRGSADPSAKSILEPGSEVAPLPNFTAAMVLPKEGKTAWPQCCCLCGGPAETSVNPTKKEGGTSLIIWGVPYCMACRKKTTGIFFRKAKEKPGVEIIRVSPPTLAFRNERYWAMFMEANRIR